ncbi:MAG: GNAT family N-acetyltransferase [Nanobdellota archaeon]
MIVRKANQKDVKDIHEIAEKVRLNTSNPQPNGFLIYVLDENGYSDRLISPYFYVAVDKGKTIGFLMCYDNKTVDELAESGKLDHEDGFLNYLSKIKEPYILTDQLGILPEYARIGAGKLLMNTLIKDMKKAKIYRAEGIVSNTPLNKASTSFLKKYGSKKVGEIKNKDNHVWDIYSGKLFS